MTQNKSVYVNHFYSLLHIDTESVRYSACAARLALFMLPGYFWVPFKILYQIAPSTY